MNTFKLEDLLILALPLILACVCMSLWQFPSPEGINLNIISLGFALSIALIAFFRRYLSPLTLWYIIIGVPFVASFAIVYVLPHPVSIFTVVLQNITTSIFHYILIRLFYHKSLVRFRMLVCSFLAALIFSTYYSTLHHLVELKILPGFWMQSFYIGFILHLFIFFGLSMAELIVLRQDVKRLKNEANDQDA